MPSENNEPQTRAERLKELRDTLKNAIDNCESMRDLAALAKQYRETIRELEEIAPEKVQEDSIAALVEKRKAAGKSGAVRPNRA